MDHSRSAKRRAGPISHNATVSGRARDRPLNLSVPSSLSLSSKYKVFSLNLNSEEQREMKGHVYLFVITCKQILRLGRKTVLASSIHMTCRGGIFLCSVSVIHCAPTHRRKRSSQILLAEHPGKTTMLLAHSFGFNTKTRHECAQQC